MFLTPIPIPGKRKRGTTKVATDSRKTLKRKPGRPFKLLDYEPSLKSPLVKEPVKKNKKRTLKNLKSRNKMSNLEKLPTELLEKVFLHCLNIELPRSSPILAGKLSSSIVYTQTLLAAFRPTWDHWCTSNDVDALGAVACPILQSAILKCRWASLPNILQTKDIWGKRYTSNKVIEPIYFMKPTEQLHRNAAITATHYFEADYEAFNTYIVQATDGIFQENITWDSNHDIDRDVEIPQTLLSGVWTEEKVRYLFWLCRSGVRIQWGTSVMGEVARDGLKDAIREGNIKAITLLNQMGLEAEFHIDTLIFAIQNAGGNKFATVNQFLKSCHSMSSRDSRKLRMELSSMEEEAILDEDDDKLKFMKAILDSPALNVH